MTKSRKERIEEEKELEEVKAKKVKRVVEEDNEEEYEEITTEERIVNIEKKVNQIFAISVIGLIIAAVALIVLLVNNDGSGKANTNEEANQQEQQQSASYDISDFKEIKATDIATESKKETIVVMIGRQGCGYCAQFAPVLTAVGAEYGVTVRYIDLAKIIEIGSGSVLDQDSITAISKITGDGQWASFATDYFARTPQTMFIKNNKVVYGIAGAADENTTRAAFEAAGFKKK